MKKNNRFEKMCAVAGCILLLLVALISYLNIFHLLENIHTDIIAEMNYGRAVWETKNIFPQNWYFGSEYSFFRPAIIYALVYGLTGNYMMSQSVSLIVTLLIIIIGILSFAFSMEIQKKGIAIMGTLLFISMSGTYRSFPALNFLYYGYYGFYFALIVFTIGFIAREYHHDRFKLLKIYRACLIVSAFATGFVSIRMTMYLYLPLFCAFLFLTVMKMADVYKRKGCILIKEYVSNSCLRDVLILLIINCAGVIAGRMCAERFQLTIDVLQISWVDFYKVRENIWLNIVAMQKMLFGTSDSHPVFSLITIDGGIKGILIAVLIWSTVKNRKKIVQRYEFWALFFSLSVVFGVMTFTTYGSGAASYYFVLPLLFVYLTFFALKEGTENHKQMIGALILCIAVTNAFVYYVPYLKGTVNQEPKQVAEWLEENGYETIYTTFWEAAPIEAGSDGKIRVGYLNMDAEGNLTEHRSIVQKDLFDITENSIFVFNEEEEKKLLNYSDSILNRFDCEKVIDIGYLNVYKFLTCNPMQVQNMKGSGNVFREDNRVLQGLQKLGPPNTIGFSKDSVALSNHVLAVKDAWAFDTNTNKTAKNIYFKINEKLYRLDYGQPRPDVAAFFDNSELLETGFIVNMTISDDLVIEGKLTISLIIIGNDGKGYYESEPITLAVQSF